jgi:hypothetical protein
MLCELKKLINRAWRQEVETWAHMSALRGHGVRW